MSKHNKGRSTKHDPRLGLDQLGPSQRGVSRGLALDVLSDMGKRHKGRTRSIGQRCRASASLRSVKVTLAEKA